MPSVHRVVPKREEEVSHRAKKFCVANCGAAGLESVEVVEAKVWGNVQ